MRPFGGMRYGGRDRGHFTDPTATPRVRVLWKMRKKTMAGRMPSSDDAAVPVMSVVCSPCSCARATGTVWLLLETRKMSGSRNSFHVQMKKNVNSTESVGKLTGTTTRQR